MRKFLTYIFIVTILLVALMPTHVTHASCGVFPPNSILDCVPNIINDYIIAPLMNFILKIMAYLLGIAGWALNYIIDYTIVHMKENIAGFTGINTGWKVVRDIMNMAFIFMLVYEAILIILSRNSVSDIRKFISGIVLASILINFSLFFTKVMIDASNIVTIGFYDSAIAGYCGGDQECGLSDPLMGSLGISSIHSTTIVDQFSQQGGELTGMILLAMGGGLIILIASFVFLAMSVLFIVRYVALLFLLMFSPIAYMGLALPFMEDYQKSWWKAFKSQVLFGPIFMMMMWVVIKLMTTGGFLQIDAIGGFDKVFVAEPDYSYMGIIFKFAVIIGLLIMAMITAKNTSSKGSDIIGNATKNLSSFAGGAIMGSAATVGRGTLGRAGNALANNERLKEMEAKGGFFARNFIAKPLRSTGVSASNSSFDVRSSGGMKALSKQTGFNFGTGADNKKVNFVKDKENKEKKIAERVEKLKPSEDAAERAKTKLNDEDFKREEERRREEFFKENPDALSETKDKELELKQAEAKAKTEKEAAQGVADATTNLVRASEQEIAKLKRELEEQVKIEERRPGGNTANVTAARQKVEREEAKKKDLDRQLETEKSALENKKKAHADAEKAITENQKREQEIRNKWMSEERKKAIAQAGGTTEEKKGNIITIKDAAGNIIGKKNADTGKMIEGVDVSIDSAYKQRVEAVISRHEAQGGYNTPKGTGGGTMARWTKNILKTSAGVVVPGLAAVSGGDIPMPTTARDNRDIVRAIRKKTKQKSEEDEAMEAMKKLAKKQADKEKEESGEGEAETKGEEKKEEKKDEGGGEPKTT